VALLVAWQIEEIADERGDLPRERRERLLRAPKTSAFTRKD
jgi:hypothetical protein